MEATRRAFLWLNAAAGAMLAANLASAEEISNSELLRIYFDAGQMPIQYDGNFSFVAGVEAIRVCQVFVPLAFGYRGLRLSVRGTDGKFHNALFNPPLEAPPPQMFDIQDNFVRLVPGAIVALRTTAPSKTVFPSRGEFDVQLEYVPEPVRELTNVKSAIVIEGGEVLSPIFRISVV